MSFHKGARALFDDLLMTALNGALPLPDMNGISQTITEHLDFDMMTFGVVTLHENACILEQGLSS
jgi:hypothetical protein